MLSEELGGRMTNWIRARKLREIETTSFADPVVESKEYFCSGS
jgi:hypothetical protein